MSALLEQIKSKGHWVVRIHPATYLPRRIDNILELRPLVQRLAVQFRGWDFPHTDSHQRPVIADNWVGEEIDWEGIRETWRIYQSGQFIYFGVFSLDWPGFAASNRRSQPFEPQGPALPIEDIVACYSEFLEFAARLSLSPLGAETMTVQVDANGLLDRHLCCWSPFRLGFIRPYIATLPSFAQGSDFRREALAADARSVAFNWARELVRRFEWEPAPGVLESIYNEIRGERAS
jgi:hypothetical protein